MSPVKIVGGGLTGILAALQAHRLGARQIDLYERFDRLGGIALPEMRDGREMREGCIYFGPQGDPIRTLLETHGIDFEDFDNLFGSVCPSTDGPVYVRDFGGPALPVSSINLAPLRGESLADRLACYDRELAAPLARYIRWHVGCEAEHLHASAAVPLAINRIFPTGVPLDELCKAKRTDSLSNELFGIPRSMWNYSANTQASLPVGGFTKMFRQCRAALNSVGVRIHERKLAKPKDILSNNSPDDVAVWAASPMPLFKPMGLKVPKAPARLFSTYTFEARWTGPLPFYVQNFTASGSCFRVYIYESAGDVLLTAECVSKDGGSELINDIHTMLEGFDGKLTIGNLMFRAVKPRWLYHSVDTINRLGELRTALKARKGMSFVAGAWETYAKAEKFTEVEAGLRQSLECTMAVEAL